MASRSRCAVPLALSCLLSTIAVDGAWAQSLPCEGDTSRYEGFAIRHARVARPFSFLGGIALQTGDVVQRPGTAFHAAETAAIAKTLRDGLGMAALPEVPFSITAVPAFLENCDEGRKQVDLVYYLFTTRVVVPRSWTWESAKDRRIDPRTAAGVVSPATRLKVSPIVRFDDADGLVGGAQLVVDAPLSGVRLMADGAGSTEFGTGGAELSGRQVFEKASLWQLAYAAGLRARNESVERETLEQGFGYGWVSGATRPLPRLGGAVRYGAQYERGRQESLPEASGSGISTSYSAVKLLGGLSGGKGRHDYVAQAGLQLGSTTRALPSVPKGPP